MVVTSPGSGLPGGFEVADKVRIYYDPNTDECGWQKKITNKTGANSVKGTLVSISTAVDNSFILQSNEYDTIGVVYEADVADGSDVWVWMDGATCQVLYEDSFASTRGNILIASGTDGRAEDISNPGGGLPGTDTHFKECGHIFESKAGGTDVLVKANLHFN